MDHGEPRRTATVFVYRYGGGFNEGAGSIQVYDGEALARKGLVAVTINCRVGVFGFLAHPDLAAECVAGAARQTRTRAAGANRGRPRPWTDVDRRLADAVSSYWVRFATTGNPNGPGLRQWPALAASAPQVMVLGASPGPCTMPAAAVRTFFATAAE